MIYFIQDEGSLLIKIGYTGGDPTERMRSLQTANGSRLVLIAAIPGEPKDERSLHERFAGSRAVGEWFKLTPDLMQFLAAGLAEQRARLKEGGGRNPHTVWPYRVYLAGKMTPGTVNRHKDWRHEILDEGGVDTAMWGVVADLDEYPIHEKAIFDTHAFTGPRFVDKGGVHVSFRDGNHGVEGSGLNGEDDGAARGRITDLCRGAINRSDVLFAWIDAQDCYGTIAEIGYAVAKDKRVWVASPKAHHDMWFVFRMAEWRSQEEYDSPRAALKAALRWDERLRARKEAGGKFVDPVIESLNAMLAARNRKGYSGFPNSPRRAEVEVGGK